MYLLEVLNGGLASCFRGILEAIELGPNKSYACNLGISLRHQTSASNFVSKYGEADIVSVLTYDASS